MISRRSSQWTLVARCSWCLCGLVSRCRRRRPRRAAALGALSSKKLHVSFFQAHTIVNNPMDHVLQPRFELLPSASRAEFLQSNNIKTAENLPIIKFHEDMVARIMALMPGDIVKITRASPSAGEYVSYRICRA